MKDLIIAVVVVAAFLALYVPSFWLAGNPARRWAFFAVSTLLGLGLSAVVLGVVVIAAIGGSMSGPGAGRSWPTPWSMVPVLAHFLVLSLAPFLKRVHPAALCVAANVLLFGGLLCFPGRSAMAIVYGVFSLASLILWVRLIRGRKEAGQRV